MKRTKLLLLLVMLMVSIGTWATVIDPDKTPYGGIVTTLPTTAGTTLEDGYIYKVENNVEITATSSQPALAVPDRGTVTIYIAKDVTLTINGNGRYAGIFVPSASTLIITGEGKLIATSGMPSYGNAGISGGAASFKDEYAITGGGGKGGAGGYGAGAAIGGNGGSGGNAKSGPDGACYYTEKKAYYGTKANAGNNGSNGYTMGTVYIMGTVTVNASNASGMNGSAPSRGSWGAEATKKWTNTYYAGGGGPGGNGGPGSYNAYAIGGGGYGGGSGASGASGGLSWHGSGNTNYKNCYGYSGGNGAGYNQSRSSGTGYGNATKGESYDIRWGGATAYGGYAGSNGGNGTVYKIVDNGTHYSSPTISGANTPIQKDANTIPRQVWSSIYFNNNTTPNSANDDYDVNYFGLRWIKKTVPVRDGYYFQGYYTARTGGTKVFNADGTPVNSVCTYAHNTVLYAHWVYTHHDMYWDYSYDKNGTNTYDNLQLTDHIKYARLTFYNSNGEAVKKVILTAYNVNNKENITAAFDTHTTAHASITLATSGTQNLVGENVVIVSTNDEMSAFTSYIFEPLASNEESAKKATNWSATTNKETHTTVLNFTGATGNNLYQQKWSVNLIGLDINPDYIFVKPLFKNGYGEWEEISQLVSSTGVQCIKTSETTTEVNGMNLPLAVYSGSYPVWKKGANDNNYEYAIGLVGFILKGHTYYMNTTHPGAWEPHFTSPTNDSDLKYTAITNKTIAYNVSAATIPVVRFMTDESKGESPTDATPFILVKGYGETIENFATTYQATRYGYTFDGWKDSRTNYEYGADYSLTVTGAHTVTPVWSAITSTLQLWDGTEITATYGEQLPNITAPTRTGYTFHGYYTEENGEGIQYYNAEGVSDVTWNGLSAVTLYAYWTANTYTITLHTGVYVEEEGNKKELTSTVTATYDEKLPGVTVPERIGYEFLGYFPEENGAGSEVYDRNGHTSKVWNEVADKTLYAHWTQKNTWDLTANEDPDNPGDFYTTFYYSNKDYRAPSDVIIYTASIDDVNDAQSEIVIRKVYGNIIPANQGVILKATTKNFTLTESSYTTTFDKNDLTGIDEEKLPEGDCLILSYGERYLGFYQAPSDRYLTAHKAYLETSTGAKALTFVFNDRNNDNTTTAIENVSAENHDIDSTVIYRLDGTRVNKLQKGINIVGGKKYIMK